MISQEIGLLYQRDSLVGGLRAPHWTRYLNCVRLLVNPPRYRVDNSGRDMARLQVVGECAHSRHRNEQVIQMGEQLKRDVGPMSESRLPSFMRVLGVSRVSTKEQTTHGHFSFMGLGTRIEEYVAARSWE